MKILFSPSETKNEGGAKTFSYATLFCPMNTTRLSICETYEKALESDNLYELFGTHPKPEWLTPLTSRPTLSAFQRYSGTAYEALDFDSLNEKEKQYLASHTLIFSNLFGPVLGGDFLPDYKFKQGAKLLNITIEKEYKKNFSGAICTWIGDEEVFDLRAGFYNKFYTPHKAYHTATFLKEGKTVSHWAKYYRGKVLRTLAKIEGRIERLETTPIEGLNLEQIKESSKGWEWVYTIL